MSEEKIIWKEFKTKFGNTVDISCRECDYGTEEFSVNNGSKRCGHENHIFVWSKRSKDWEIIRERPPKDKQVNEKCPQRVCNKGSRICQLAHSDAELYLWKILNEKKLFVMKFLDSLLYESEGRRTQTGANTETKKLKKKTKYKNIHNFIFNNNNHLHYRDNKLNVRETMESFLKRDCDGGRFLFACEDCYKLEPHIIKEMEMSYGKDQKLLCSWCQKSRGLLLHERKEKYDNGSEFYEYEVIRPRKSTTLGNSLCRRFPDCDGTDCTFAHGHIELLVWKFECRAHDLTRSNLVDYCNSEASPNRATLDGVVYCDRCCMRFLTHTSYSKYMGVNHEHFPEIYRKSKQWRYGIFSEKTFELCRFDGADCPKRNRCSDAHIEEEMLEWKERLKLQEARAKFTLRQDYIPILQRRIHEQRLESVKKENRLQLIIDETDKNISIDTKTTKWKMKIVINDSQLVLRHVSFPLSQEYKLRHIDQESYTDHVELDDLIRRKLEFRILFTNPNCYGRHVGELVFEFESGKMLMNLLFRITIKGAGVDMTELKTNLWIEDWTAERIVIEYYPKQFNNEEEYGRRIVELKNNYALPKFIDENAELQDLSTSNYVEQMHALLYREENARRKVLAKLNIECGVDVKTTVSKDGHCLACFQVPVIGSSEEGVLFKESCSTVCVGKKNDRYAYEAIVKSWEENEVLIYLSPKCVKDLELAIHEITTLHIQFQLDRDTFCLRHYAVDGIRNKLSLICPSINAYANLNHGKNVLKCEALDDMQNDVYRFLHLEKEKRNFKKSYPPLIVAGPFGTGKTHTIKNILFDLLENSNNKTTILLCTLSNSAADLYLKDEKFEKWGPKKILRVMYHGRSLVTVKDAVKRYCLIDQGSNCFRYPKLEELRSYKLVITTFLTSYTLSAVSGGFTYILLDEASQAMEADVIMPLTLAGAEDSRILIAGDHKQITERLYSCKVNQVPTLLERMYSAYDMDKRCRVLLTNNYRCVEGILQLITKLFYIENILRKAGNAECIPGAQPVYFIHVQGECIETSNGEFVNEVEANQIMLEIKELVKRELAKQNEVVVISAFLQQVKLIRKILRKEGLGEVEVQTVRNIQGQQYKIVVLCTVMQRTSCFTGDNFGFLSDSRLLNTALTRAQSMIIAVGDAVTLCSTGNCMKYWKEYLKFCKEEGTILPPTVDVDSIKREIQLAKQPLSASAQEFRPIVESSEIEETVASDHSDNQRDHLDHEEKKTVVSDVLTQDSSMEDDDDDDDDDSWCSYDSIEDIILEDMLKKTMGIDITKVTVDVRSRGQEFIKYGDDDDDYDDEDDPNVMHSNHKSRRSRATRREAIFPKYDVRHLEQFLRRDGDNYKRCRIKLINWCTALAIPLDEEAPNIGVLNQKNITRTSGDDDGDTSNSISEVSESGDDNYSLESDSEQIKSAEAVIKPITVSPVIYIGTKKNLGRTFDKDEVLVQITETSSVNPITGTSKRYGKVLGLLKKRYRNPRSRYFLCRPDENNSAIMCPIDKKLTKFGVLCSKNLAQSGRSKIAIYRPTYQGKDFNLKHVGYEKVDGQRVYAVRYLKWSEHCKYPLGFVEKSFPLSNFKQFLKLEFGVAGDYKDSLKKKAKNLRLPTSDRRPIDVFTIDPEGSMDLDDAISFEECKEHDDCFQIGIHITDVASVIEEGSGIDREAQKRVTTFYGSKKDSPVHMLPPELSTDKLSLLPDKPRPAISTYFHSSEDSPHDKDFTAKEPVRSFVKSFRRLTYREAEDLLRRSDDNKDTINSVDLSLSKHLKNLWKIMWDWRVSRLDGAAVYKDSDNFADIAAECRAHLLIEEAMISVNANTAAYLTEKDYKVPIRVQEVPEEGDWRAWDKMYKNLIPNSSYAVSCSKYLKKLKRVEEGGRVSDENISEDEQSDWIEATRKKKRKKKKKLDDLPSGGSVHPLGEIQIFTKYWKELLRCNEKEDYETFNFIAGCDDLHPSLVSTIDRFRRIQKKSDFVSSPKPHFSLRLEQYTQSSSPIRRYVDIIIQRCIHKALEGGECTDMTKDAVEKFCCQYEDRDRQYDKKLLATEMAESLKYQPYAVEACVIEITDASLNIAIPSLKKFFDSRARELQYRNMSVLANTSENNHEVIKENEIPRTSTGEIILDKVLLVWKLRYYNCERDGEINHKKMIPENRSTIKIHAGVWKSFVQIISKQPRLCDSAYKKIEYQRNLKIAIEGLIEDAEVKSFNSQDVMCGGTRNNPKPIYHIRKITWNMTPGTPLTLQVSSSTMKNQLPTPAVQLVSIASDLDVCVEHLRDPVNVFAGDAESIANKKVVDLISYQQKWEPLIRMEAADSAVKEGCSITLEGVKIRWKKMEKVAAKDDGFGPVTHGQRQSKNYFKLSSKFCNERYIDIFHGYLLCLRQKGVPNVSNEENDLSALHDQPSHSTHTAVLHAVVTSVKKPAKKNELTEIEKDKIIKVYFKVLQDHLMKDNRSFDRDGQAKWTVEVIPLSFVHRHMAEALNTLDAANDVIQRICLGSIRPSPIKWDPDFEKIAKARVLKGFPYPLNEEQYNQEQKALRHDFSLIQGPPGTGKSFLGAQMATKFVNLNKIAAGKSNSSTSKVLYCGPSNKSVDVVADFLKDIKDLKVVRLYSTTLEEKLYPNPLKPSQLPGSSEDDAKIPDERLKRMALHELIRDPTVVGSERVKEIRIFDSRVKHPDKLFTRKDMNRYTAAIMEAKDYVLKNCDIIICTCSSACKLIQTEEQWTVGQCIIDECAMCSEPETILPLIATKPKQVVLIGDHKQLRPVITCNAAEKLGLANSLFNRYSEFAGMLTTQYRMHYEIMEFPSRQFYKGQLTCDKTVVHRVKERRDPFRHMRPAIFWNVRGEERIQHFKSVEGGTKSKYNMAEVYAVIKLLQKLHDSGISLNRVMVLSPYTAQCARIRERIKNRSQLKNVHVGTVVTSQGSEADYVILSAVRSLPDSSIVRQPNVQWLRKNLGFIIDPNQVNVALTRARRRLFIIGNKQLLRVDELWNALLSSYEKKRSVVNDLLPH